MAEGAAEKLVNLVPPFPQTKNAVSRSSFSSERLPDQKRVQTTPAHRK